MMKGFGDPITLTFVRRHLETSGLMDTHDKQGYSRQLPQSQRDRRSNVSSVLFLDANAKKNAIDAVVKGNRYQLE